MLHFIKMRKSQLAKLFYENDDIMKRFPSKHDYNFLWLSTLCKVSCLYHFLSDSSHISQNHIEYYIK